MLDASHQLDFDIATVSLRCSDVTTTYVLPFENSAPDFMDKFSDHQQVLGAIAADEIL
jgi:hypothetical protein